MNSYPDWHDKNILTILYVVYWFDCEWKRGKESIVKERELNKYLALKGGFNG